MRYWLFKSEPGEFSIDDLESSRGRTTCWDGVRNYQARNFIRDDMQKGDRAFFYHSSCPEPGIVGTVKIVKEAYPDDTAFDETHKHYDPKSDAHSPRWYMVDITLEDKFNRIIELNELRKYMDSDLSDLTVLKKGNRLSITPVSPNEWNFIMKLARSCE